MADVRLTQVQEEADKQKMAYDQQYTDMLAQKDALTEQQKQMIDAWGTQQKSAQEGQTNLMLDRIEQQKQETAKSYEKEQSGSYVDYTKATGAYGVNAEQMGEAGLQGSGYSESTKSTMFNTYQNRVAIAREAYGRSILEYDNNIKEAKLNYNTKLAEIAYKQLQDSLALALSDFDYRNSAWQNKLSYLNDLDRTTWGKQQDVQGQINYETQAAEEKRRWEAEIAYQKQIDAQKQANWAAEYELAKKASAARASAAKKGDEVTGGGTPTNLTYKGTQGTNATKIPIGGGYFQDSNGATYIQSRQSDGSYKYVKVGSAEYAALVSGGR